MATAAWFTPVLGTLGETETRSDDELGRAAADALIMVIGPAESGCCPPSILPARGGGELPEEEFQLFMLGPRIVFENQPAFVRPGGIFQLSLVGAAVNRKFRT